jgi:hypothetical protein
MPPPSTAFQKPSGTRTVRVTPPRVASPTGNAAARTTAPPPESTPSCSCQTVTGASCPTRRLPAMCARRKSLPTAEGTVDRSISLPIVTGDRTRHAPHCGPSVTPHFHGHIYRYRAARQASGRGTPSGRGAEGCHGPWFLTWTFSIAWYELILIDGGYSLHHSEARPGPDVRPARIITV